MSPPKNKESAAGPAAPGEIRETMDKADYPVTLDVTPRMLPVKLSDGEIITKCLELASVIQEISDEEQRQANEKADMKSRLSKLDDRKLLLSRVVTKGEEYRSVDVEIIVNENDHITEVRTDTGEIVVSRQAKDSERQLALMKFKEKQEKAGSENGTAS